MFDTVVRRLDQGGIIVMCYQIIAESDVHPGRRLLRGNDGDGYIQLDSDAEPIAVPEHDFARLRAMQHYRSVAPDLSCDPLAEVGGQESLAF